MVEAATPESASAVRSFEPAVLGGAETEPVLHSFPTLIC